MAWMDFNLLLSRAPFSFPQAEKEAIFAREMEALSAYHRAHCPTYARLSSLLGQDAAPMLPVALFKQFDLRSVPAQEVVQTLTSSQTTAQQPSQISLDAQTAYDQQRALHHIVSDFIGEDRLPMLILDAPQSVRGASSARRAGILGMRMFGSPVVFAFKNDMTLDVDAVQQFMQKFARKKVLLFGFTYLIWQHFLLPLEQMGLRFALQEGYLIHGGGWKKLQQQAVSETEFRARLARACGALTIMDYYGMAEQTGSIFMQCSEGHYHASIWSDVRIRRSQDFSLCRVGEEGILQVCSLLPRSYPGHSLLTEDLGTLLGVDDCPCGRLGAYFAVRGRIPRAEIRGCSDTYEAGNSPTGRRATTESGALEEL